MTIRLKSVDTIGALDAEIAKLAKRRDRLAANIKEYRGTGTYEGDIYIGTAYEAEAMVPNVAKLKKHFGADWRKYLQPKPYMALRVTKKGAKRKAAE